MIDYETKDNEYLCYGPLSSDTFNEVWMFGDIRDGALALQNQTYLSRETVKYYLSMKTEKASELAKEYESYEFFFMTTFNDIDTQNYWWWQKIFRSYARPLLENHQATAEILLKIINTDASPNWAWKVASHPNLPIEESASLVLAHSKTAGIALNQLSRNISVTVEAKCDDYLSIYGWDKETLDVTSLDMKMKVIAS